MQVITTLKFEDWFLKLSLKDQIQIKARLIRLIEFGHYGDFKNLGEDLFELRWKSGRRLYFTKQQNKIILLLLGGFKNGQKKDIKKARALIKRYARRSI